MKSETLEGAPGRVIFSC